ncbi:MAG: preprotein translocase subunit SecG [Gammaproteobacteria bacterium]|nr:preprotein translocase subunit SecG [Gammaproteobacteria bacterium]
MHTLLVVIHLALSVTLIGLVLIQRGKGAEIGAAFGSGASTTVFGSQGSASFLTRTTGIVATLFFITSLVLAYFATQHAERTSSIADLATQAPAQPSLPSGAVAPADVPTLPAAPGKQ